MLDNQGQGICPNRIKLLVHTTIQSAFLLGLIAAPAAAISLKPLGTYSTGTFDAESAFVSAFDPGTANLFVTNRSNKTIDILNINNPSNPFLTNTIDITAFDPSYGNVLSVAYNNYNNRGLFAVTVENINRQAPGSLLFFNPDGSLFNGLLENSSLMVGALPDSLTFTPDGKKLLVANEGEATPDYSVDPESSVSIINIENLFAGVAPSIKFLDFTEFNPGGSKADKIGSTVRIFGPNAIPSRSLEPEYITVSEDGKKAWVTFQENNALGLLDLETEEFTEIVGLGFKDYSLTGLDASDRDNAINIKTYPNLFGMYQPDEARAYTVNGETYIVIANEGSAIDFDGEGEFNESARVRDLKLDPVAFPNAAELQKNAKLGRLEVTTTMGDTDGDGDFDQLYAFGGRSFSILDSKGNLVFDSGDQFEQITAERYPEYFNATNSENDFDSRSDAKGPEPEGVTIAKRGDKTYAFIGLERIGGVMIYDITNPKNPTFVNYSNNRNFNVKFTGENEDGDPIPTPEELLAVGDLGPEGLLFIPAKDSPTGKDLFVTTNEVSGTTTISEVVPEPGTIAGLIASGLLGKLFLKRKEKNA